MTKDQNNEGQERPLINNKRKSTAYDFLFEAENNEYDEIYKDYIDGQDVTSLHNTTLEELWGIIYGNVDIEKRKEKYREQRDRSDYEYGSINIVECPMCGNDEVPIIDIEVNVNLSGRLFKSICFEGAKCTMCSELFFSKKTTNALIRLSGVFDKLFTNSENE